VDGFDGERSRARCPTDTVTDGTPVVAAQGTDRTRPAPAADLLGRLRARHEQDEELVAAVADEDVVVRQHCRRTAGQPAQTTSPTACPYRSLTALNLVEVDEDDAAARRPAQLESSRRRLPAPVSASTISSGWSGRCAP
jgi:hypothetical protein